MRHSWRLLLLRTYTRSSPHVSSTSPHLQRQVKASCSPYLSSLRTLPQLSPSLSPRHFSSEPMAEPSKDSDNNHLHVSDVFTKFSDVNDIGRELEQSGVVLTHDLVLRVLKSLQSNVDAARRFFGWVLEKDEQRLSSKGYNWMLGILGTNGCTVEFWDLVVMMAKKGYGMSRVTHDRVKDKFEKEGLDSDLRKLRAVFTSASADDSVEKLGVRISRVIRNNVWSEDVETQIKEFHVTYSTDLVKTVVDSLAMEPNKALIFFRWIDESGLFTHDQGSYNAIARVLGREDCIDRFCKVTDEMKSKGYEMEDETFAKVLGRFAKRKLHNEVVDLYEFAMAGVNKPPLSCCVFILRKIAAAKQLDMVLFSRVMKIYTGAGNALTDSMLDSVLKSLTTAGRYEECNKVLKEMKECGFTASGNLQGKIAFKLGSSHKKNEANAFLEAFGSCIEKKAWVPLIKGHCASGDLETASACFQQMASKLGICNTASYAFELLASAYCSKDQATEACSLLHQCVKENQLKPFQTTYKLLISKSLVQEGGFKDAVSLLDSMRSHGFPPFVDPFISYLSKNGTADDGVIFLKSITASKKFPSTPMVLQVFEAILKSGRRSAAQDLLSKCPGYIREHADVLNLFSPTVKPVQAPAAVPVAV
ncbi:unnamed protein product [Linum tenue]|uniref:Pentatricopeptide repeat-containing protein n=1 Tax=Linum tenue TaxID=586396 RepID=A0AAV0HSZ6_9ROSI|nr:unnamed protein product [Linum tenue]